MPKKYSKTPYATFNGEPVLYVTLAATGIHPLVVYCDGLSVLIEKPNSKHPKTFMKVTDVIAWHTKELKESNGQSGNARVAELLQLALEKFEKENTPSEKELGR